MPALSFFFSHFNAILLKHKSDIIIKSFIPLIWDRSNHRQVNAKTFSCKPQFMLTVYFYSLEK